MSVASSPTTFAVLSRGLDRLDVNYSLTRSVGEQQEKRVSLGSLTLEIRYGSNTRATSEPDGTPMIRMGNIVDGTLDLSDLKYVVLTEKELDRHLLHDGDVLINRTNTKELVGKAAVFRGDRRFVFASYIIRLRVDESRILPEFLTAWLNSADARAQIDKVSRQVAGMTNINSQDIRALRVPLPLLRRQAKLIAKYESERVAYLRKVADAKEMLSKVSREVLRRLNIREPSRNSPLAYGVEHAVVALGGRLDVRFNHPERVSAIEAITGTSYRLLGDIVDIVTDRAPATNTALSLSAVARDTGQLVDQRAEDLGQSIAGALHFESGDILYARLRPELNKVWLAGRPGDCSPEFRVLRIKNAKSVRREFLAAILRTSPIVAQTKHAITGNTHPRVSDDDLLKVVVPVPDREEQRAIAQLVKGRHLAASKLDREAVDRWTRAKVAFARALAVKPS